MPDTSGWWADRQSSCASHVGPVHRSVRVSFRRCHVCPMDSEPEQISRTFRIAVRAYDKWVRRDTGNPLQDWLEAEEEVGRLSNLDRNKSWHLHSRCRLVRQL